MKERAMWLVIVMLFMVLFVVGCGGGENGEGAGGSTEPSGHELVVGLPEANNNFDPFGAYGDETLGHMQVYDTLVVKGRDGKIAPSLTESYEVSEDGLTYTFYLNKGVKFSNGADFTAADAKFSVDQGVESAFTNWAMVGVESSEQVDDYTITVTLKNADVSFLEKLTWIYVVSEEAFNQLGEDYGKTIDSTIGTGPYILKEWEPGQLCVYEANPDYFKGEADVKKVRVKSISDTNAAMIALQTGEIGLYLKDVPGIAVDSLASNDKVELTYFSSYVFMDIVMNCESEPFDDLRLRQAVAYGVDREKMLQIGAEGQGTIVDYPGGPDYIGNPGLSVFHGLDVEKAQQLVVEAGLEGRTVTIKTMDMEPWPKLATALQDELNRIGLDAKVEQLEMNAYSQDVWQNGQYEIAISRYWSGTKDMSETMSLLEPGGSMNFSRYVNHDVEPFLVEASAEMDESVRKQLYKEVIDIFVEDVPLIPLYYTMGTRAYSKDLAIDEGNVEYDRFYYYSWKE